MNPSFALYLFLCLTLLFHSACQTTSYRSWQSLSHAPVSVQCKDDSSWVPSKNALISCRFRNESSSQAFLASLPEMDVQGVDLEPIDSEQAQILAQEWKKKHDDRVATAVAVILVVGVIALLIAAKNTKIKRGGKTYRVKAVRPIVPVHTQINLASHIHHHHFYENESDRGNEAYQTSLREDEWTLEEDFEDIQNQPQFVLAPGETIEYRFAFHKGSSKKTAKKARLCFDLEQEVCQLVNLR